MKSFLFVFVQVLSVTSSAEYCEQYVAYACRMSRLLNTPGEAAQTPQLCLSFHSHMKYLIFSINTK